MFEQKFAFSLLVFVHMRQFHFDLYCFFEAHFFLKWIFIPFVVHFKPCCLFEPNFHFSLVVLCSHAAFWRRFLKKKINLILKMVFPIHSWSILGLLFCIVNGISLNCTS